MKKFLLTTTMLVGFVAIAQAQQGRVGINTTTPGATLDVVATTTDATRPDAVLVPRMTATELNAKNAAYVAAQNGALVFVTSGTGVAATKTANVTGTGFYYYDSPTSLWVAVGGGAATPRYETIRGNMTFVNAATYTVLPTDNVVVTQFNNGVAITLPTLTNTAADVGRVIKIVNNNTAASGLTFSGPTPTGANLIINQGRGIEFIWTGTLWTSPQK